VKEKEEERTTTTKRGVTPRSAFMATSVLAAEMNSLEDRNNLRQTSICTSMGSRVTIWKNLLLGVLFFLSVKYPSEANTTKANSSAER